MIPAWVFAVAVVAFLVIIIGLHTHHQRARRKLEMLLRGFDTQIKTANSVDGRVKILEANAPKIKGRVEKLEQGVKATENEVNKVAVATGGQRGV